MSVAKEDSVKKVTTRHLVEMKQRGEKVSMLTAYDYSMAKLIDQAGIDVILVGDSASNVMAGNQTTLPITLDQMIYHATSVVKGVNHALVVVDLPFGTYQGNPLEALASAVRVMRETGADCLKLEGGSEIRESIERILCAGIPVMGHLGLTPQSIHKFGTYSVRAREEAESRKPGGGVDGQVLVMHDMLGINQGFSPKFLRRYANIGDEIVRAVQAYVGDVKSRDFPNETEQY